MESKINYTLVGLFVVLLSAGLVVFAYWLEKYSGQQKYDYYHIYMSESVAGLSADASVKYRGVDVGAVEYIGLSSKNSEQVELLIRIKNNTPVKVDTTATIKSFGLTGLAYVELEGGKWDAPLLKPTDEDEIPVISARLSTFARAYDSMSHLAEKSTKALDKFNQLLSKDNLQNVAAILSETRMLAEDIRGQRQAFRNLIDKGVVMEERITSAFDKVEVASVSVAKMADSLDKNYADVGSNINQSVHQSLTSFNRLVYDLDILTGQLQRTTQSIEASPSDLIFKRSVPKPGPGENGYNEK